MNGLDLLGADPVQQKLGFSWSRGTLALAAGAFGAFVLRRSHPVLGFLNASALASNVHAVVAKERSWQNAGRRMGRHFIATAGSLALPKYPVIGYVAGAVGADMLIDDDGSGIIQEWAQYTGVGGRSDIIDAEIVEVPSTALVRRQHMHSTPSRGGTTRRVDGGGPPGRFPGGREP